MSKLSRSEVPNIIEEYDPSGNTKKIAIKVPDLSEEEAKQKRRAADAEAEAEEQRKKQLEESRKKHFECTEDVYGKKDDGTPRVTQEGEYTVTDMSGLSFSQVKEHEKKIVEKTGIPGKTIMGYPKEGVQCSDGMLGSLASSLENGYPITLENNTPQEPFSLSDNAKEKFNNMDEDSQKELCRSIFRGEVTPDNVNETLLGKKHTVDLAKTLAAAGDPNDTQTSPLETPRRDSSDHKKLSDIAPKTSPSPQPSAPDPDGRKTPKLG